MPRRIPIRLVEPTDRKAAIQDGLKGGRATTNATGLKPGSRSSDPRWDTTHDRIFWARQAATRGCVALSLWDGHRVDVIKPGDQRGEWYWHADGFDPAWVASLPTDEWLSYWAPYAQDGWTFRFEDPDGVMWWPDGLWDAILAAIGPQNSPVTYPRADVARKECWIHQVALDNRIQACRDWVCDGIEAQVRATGADGIMVGLKSNYWRNPQLTRGASGYPAGCWTDTFYGPGEWEDAMRAILHDLRQRRMTVMLDTTWGRLPDGAHPDDPWDWLGEDKVLRDWIFGEKSGWPP